MSERKVDRAGSSSRAMSRGSRCIQNRERKASPPIVEVAAMGNPAHECPQCNGLLPADAITVSDWRLHEPTPMLMTHYCTRRVTMRCPHCGHEERRTERRPSD